MNTDELLREHLIDQKRRNQAKDKGVRVALFVLFCLVGLAVIAVVFLSMMQGITG